jgi:hypothetical protein
MMKVIYKIIIILFFTNVLSGQDWKYLSDRIGGVMSVSCPDSDNCYCLVQENLGFDDTGPLLFKSTDQGATWDSIYKSYPEKWPNITLFNTRTGLATDQNHYFIAWWDVPAISKSTDGGHTFSKIFLDTSNLYDRHLSEFTMYDFNYGYARTDVGLFFTKDGWETFEKRNYWDSVWLSPNKALFLDSNILASVTYKFSAGGRFLKYYIKQDKWDTLYNFGINKSTEKFHDIVRLYFINDSTGFACGFSSTGLGQTRDGVLFRTKDGGQNWDLIFTENSTPNFGFNDIAFYDDKRGVLLGYYGKIFFTTDGGDTWVRSYLPEGTNYQRAEIMHPGWAGHYPIVGTSGIGIYRYEGNYFGLHKPDTVVSLLSVYPEPGDTVVSVNTEITAKFGDILDTNNFNVYTYSLQNLSGGGSFIDGAYVYNPGDSTLKFTPDSALPYSSIIQVNLYNIYDKAGNVLSEYSYTFTTEADTTTSINDNTNGYKISVYNDENQLYININDLHFRRYKLQICDIYGHIVREAELNSGVGTLYYPVDISGLDNGAYLFVISTGGVIAKTGKMMIIHN